MKKTAIIILGILALLIAIALPSFIKSRNTSSQQACINNLRQIDSGREQGAMLIKQFEKEQDLLRPNDSKRCAAYIHPPIFNALNKASTSFADSNMDGKYDIRFCSGEETAVTIEGVWYDLIHTNKQLYVMMDDVLTPVESINGICKVIVK